MSAVTQFRYDFSNQVGSISDPESIITRISSHGFSFIKGSDINLPLLVDKGYIEIPLSFERLPQDRYLKDDSKFRFRRYSRLGLREGSLSLLPHKPYFQSSSVNNYAGGMERHFEALEPETLAHPLLKSMVLLDFELFPLSLEERNQQWEVGIHQVRVIAEGSRLGYPTPEGIHRDGNDFFAVHLINLRNAAGGISSIYNENRSPIGSFRLSSPFDSVLVDDTKVLHSVTPISATTQGMLGVRDIFIIDFFRSSQD